MSFSSKQQVRVKRKKRQQRINKRVYKHTVALLERVPPQGMRNLHPARTRSLSVVVAQTSASLPGWQERERGCDFEEGGGVLSNDDNKTDHVTLMPSALYYLDPQNPAVVYDATIHTDAHTHTRYFQLQGGEIYRRTRFESGIPINYVSLFFAFYFIFIPFVVYTHKHFTGTPHTLDNYEGAKQKNCLYFYSAVFFFEKFFPPMIFIELSRAEELRGTIN